MLHAACNSVTNPLFFSITADYFPRNQRGIANSLLQSANYIGITLSSINIIVIKNIGWRRTYNLMGFLGMAVGVLAALFVREPRPTTEPNVRRMPPQIYKRLHSEYVTDGFQHGSRACKQIFLSDIHPRIAWKHTMKKKKEKDAVK